MRTVPALLLAGLVAWLVTPAQADPRTRLVIGMGQFPPDMHPMITSTSIKDFILDSALRPMTGFNRRGEVICILCTEVPSITNGRARLVDRPDGSKGIEVTYTLKPDLFWGDGVPVTAADFAFAFQVSRSFAPPVSVDSVTAVDERTMQVTFDRVRYDYDRWPRFPLSEHIEEPIFKAAADPLDYGQKSALNRHPETPGLWMGPYRIAAFQPNESVRLVPNPGWKGAAAAFHRCDDAADRQYRRPAGESAVWRYRHGGAGQSRADARSDDRLVQDAGTEIRFLLSAGGDQLRASDRAAG